MREYYYCPSKHPESLEGACGVLPRDSEQGVSRCGEGQYTSTWRQTRVQCCQATGIGLISYKNWAILHNQSLLSIILKTTVRVKLFSNKKKKSESLGRGLALWQTELGWWPVTAPAALLPVSSCCRTWEGGIGWPRELDPSSRADDPDGVLGSWL